MVASTELAYVGLGSNLDRPLHQLQRAVAALAQLNLTSLDAVSNVYQSRPQGPAEQPDYLNAAVRLATGLTPHQLLESLQAIETRQGRTREIRWGPRTLDLDLLLFSDQAIESATLVVPHPRLLSRSFVLLPLQDIEPGLVLERDIHIATALAAIGTADAELFATSGQLCQACS